MTRPDVLPGETRCGGTVCGNLYTTINHIDGKVHETFLTMGKSGT